LLRADQGEKQCFGCSCQIGTTRDNRIIAVTPSNTFHGKVIEEGAFSYLLTLQGPRGTESAGFIGFVTTVATDITRTSGELRNFFFLACSL